MASLIGMKRVEPRAIAYTAVQVSFTYYRIVYTVTKSLASIRAF